MHLFRPRIALTAILCGALFTSLGALRLAPGALAAQPGTNNQRPRSADQPRRGPGLLAQMTAFHTEVPAHPFDLVLVRPTPTSITLSITSATDATGSATFWPVGREAAAITTPTQALVAGQPALITLPNLTANTAYAYRFRHQPKGASEPTTSDTFTFHTPRAPGNPFTFTIIADSHLDANMLPAAYEQTLRNALADAPDFHMDLGDTFMTDKRGRDFTSAAPQYVAQRYYLGLLCHSAPLFMTLGNHDGEWGYANGNADAMGPWSFAQRTKYFPAPLTEGPFYSGRTQYADHQGANYFDFTWGDAHVIVLDPFWFTTEKARGPGGRGSRSEPAARDRAPDADTTLTDQGWSMTLGRAQYDWLAHALDASHAKYTFVFIHHLVGGLGRASRGGIQAAPYFEWGGQNADGSNGFAQHRPGWPMPIHDLLAKHHVSAVLHGHDHLYVHEVLDGIAYQCVPQPGNVSGGTRSAAEYGYHTGTILASPGHVRVRVAPDAATVEFVRSAIADDPNTPAARPNRRGDRDPAANGSIADAYRILPR